MKKTLLIVAALGVFATAAMAQLGTGGTGARTLIQNGVGDWTSTIATGTAVTSTTTIIDCTKQKEVCLQWRQTATTGSGTADNTMVVQASVDRVNWVTTWTPVLARAGQPGHSLRCTPTYRSGPSLTFASIRSRQARTLWRLPTTRSNTA